MQFVIHVSMWPRNDVREQNGYSGPHFSSHFAIQIWPPPEMTM